MLNVSTKTRRLYTWAVTSIFVVARLAEAFEPKMFEGHEWMQRAVKAFTLIFIVIVIEHLEVISSIHSAATTDLPHRLEQVLAVGKGLSIQIGDLLLKIDQPAQVKILATSEETYTEILRTITSIQDRKQNRKKRISFAILHTGSRASSNEIANLTYFTNFVSKMRQCALSTGANQWEVRELYNVVTLERLQEIRQRVEAQTEGYHVRAICEPSHLPPVQS